MPDTPDISYRITTTADDGGLVAHTESVRDDTRAVKEQTQALREQESLTATPGGKSPFLASSYSSIAATTAEATAASSAYVITSEKEYVTAQRLLEKYQQLNLSKKLLGITDTELTAKIALLDAALSTNSALTVAETMENNALAAAEARAAEAAVVQAGAHKVNTVAMRESLVVMRELMSGNMTRLPGSLSILGGQFGIGSTVAIGAGMLYLGNILREHINKGIQEYIELTDKSAEVTLEDHNKIREAYVKTQVSAFEYRKQIEAIGTDLDPVKTATDQYISALNRQYDAVQKVEDAHRKLRDVQLDFLARTGKITPEQKITLKLDLDEKAFEAKLKSEEAKAQAILKAVQDEHDTQVGRVGGLQSDYEKKSAIAAKAEVDKARVDEGIAGSQKLIAVSQETIKKLQDDYDAAIASLQASFKDRTASGYETGTFEDFKSKILAGSSLQDAGKRKAIKEYETAQSELDKSQAILKQLQDKQVATYEQAALTAETARQAGQAWSDAMKDIRDTAREIQTKTDELKTTQQTNQQLINDSRQAVEYEKVNSIMEREKGLSSQRDSLLKQGFSPNSEGVSSINKQMADLESQKLTELQKIAEMQKENHEQNVSTLITIQQSLSENTAKLKQIQTQVSHQ